MTGFDILGEIQAYYEGMDDDLVENICLIFAIYGGDASECDESDLMMNDVKFKENIQ